MSETMETEVMNEIKAWFAEMSAKLTAALSAALAAGALPHQLAALDALNQELLGKARKGM